MKKPSKKLDLHHETRQLYRRDLARAVGGAMMAYAIDNPAPQAGGPITGGDAPRKFGPWI